LDFNQVRYFLALADSLNFTRAAERCHVSQPALTQAIKRLEYELGGELLKRDGRNTELSDLGHNLRQHFEQIDRTRSLVHATAKAVMTGELSELNIGLMCTIGPRILAGMLETFQGLHPKISIVLHDVTPETIPDLLLSGSVDGVFCARHDAPDARMRYFDLFTEPMVVAVSKGHALTNMDVVPLDEITKHPYIDRLHCEFRQEVLGLYKDRKLELNVVFRSQREDWIQSLVREGRGVSCIPRYSILSSEIDYRPISDPDLSRVLGFALANQKQASPSLELLIEHLRNHNWPS